MKYVYYLRKDYVTDDCGESVTVYGIDAADSRGYVIKRIPGVFFDADKAKHFIGLCNSLELSIVHIMDAVEDVIS